MKQVIINEPLDEMDVHPPGFYERLVDACVRSAEELLDQRDSFVETACPACDSGDNHRAFEKHGYVYLSCRDCFTIFIFPRPSINLLDWYLSSSPAAAFRYGEEYLQAMQRRFKDLSIRRAEWVSELCKQSGPDRQRLVVDIETHSPDYLVELQKRQVAPLSVVSPLGPMTDPSTMPLTNLTIFDDLAEVEGANAGLVTAFNILEHQVYPRELVRAAYSALGPGGLLVLTTRSGSGFDIQVLWEHSSVFPLEHINLITVEGLRELLMAAGFEVLEVSTPGRLDVQIIERTLKQQEVTGVPRFVRYFMEHRDQYAKQKLQRFLQENLLSSYMRVVASKGSIK